MSGGVANHECSNNTRYNLANVSTTGFRSDFEQARSMPSEMVTITLVVYICDNRKIPSQSISASRWHDSNWPKFRYCCSGEWLFIAVYDEKGARSLLSCWRTCKLTLLGQLGLDEVCLLAGVGGPIFYCLRLKVSISPKDGSISYYSTRWWARKWKSLVLNQINWSSRMLRTYAKKAMV